MPKCPYCSIELHLEDFFIKIEVKNKKGEIKNIKRGDFKGETTEKGRTVYGKSWGDVKMWVCPSCDSILGFSEYGWRT